MKILIICDKPPWSGSSGGALAIEAMINGLARHKNNIIIIYTSTKKHPDMHQGTRPEEDNPDIVSIPVRHRLRTNLMGVIINLIFSRMPYNILRYKSRRFSKKLKELLIREKFDVIQVEGLNMSVYKPLIKKNSDALLSIRSHNVEHLIWERLSAGGNSGLIKAYYKILASRLRQYELNIISSFDCLVAITHNDSKYFATSGIKIPAFIYPYAKEVEEVSQIKDNTFNISYIGSLDWKPNQEGIQWFINKVWPKIKAEDNRFKLNIAGRNAPDWLVRKFRSPGVVYHGAIDNADNFIKNCNILVIPLFSGSGIRVRLIQAMSFGIPAITGSRGLEGIEAEDDKEIIIANSSDDFVEGILRLNRDRKLYDSISKSARRFIADNYDNKRYGKALTEFYTKQLK